MHCCLDLDSVVRASNLVELQLIPNGPPFFKGTFEHAGDTVLVVDLAERLGISDHRPYTLDTPMLICRGERHVGALIVDEVLGLTRTRPNTETHEHTFDQPEVAPFKGLLLTKRGPALHLDVDAALDVRISSEPFELPETLRVADDPAQIGGPVCP